MFHINAVETYDSTTARTLAEGLGVMKSGLLYSEHPTHHLLPVLAARAERMGFAAYAKRGQLVIARQGHRGGLRVTRKNGLTAALVIAH